MKKDIDKLHHIAGKSERLIIGLMSGTSLDGLDVALCRVRGSGAETELNVEKFATVPYDARFREEVRKIFAKPVIDFQQLCLLNPYIGTLHAEMIIDCLETWNVPASDIDLIASHGQTGFHAPQKQHGIADYRNATLQIGDGDHIAVKTGIITFSDFRQKHIAAGGEGAPLAVYGDFFLFSKKDENRILLNMGGIANFTFLPGSLDAAGVFTTDTGPGNTLIDAFTRKYFDKPFDENGSIARSGSIDPDLLSALKDNAFFEQPFPKTTGPEVFNLAFVEQALNRSRTSPGPANMLATLTQFTADTICDAIKSALHEDQQYVIYASGGGAHNATLMDAIRRQLPGCTLSLLDELGISGDAKEAVLFAVLANETVAGTALYFGEKDGVPGVTLGKVSFPG